jgi:serine/threonine protein kinase
MTSLDCSAKAAWARCIYRARELKRKREVAIKILPVEFAQNSDRVSRFQREAEVLASLNHPNIATTYDLEEQSGSRYLVLEPVFIVSDTSPDNRTIRANSSPFVNWTASHRKK